jgi:salicylate hydroxylase
VWTADDDIQVFERSSFHNEVGAAIHLAPNATRVLTAWGCDLKKMDPVPCDHLSIWDSNGNFIATPAVGTKDAISGSPWANGEQITKKLQKQLNIQDEWSLVHRVDLHNALQAKAKEGAGGKRPKIHLACAVDSVVND